ncbi:hypothetical protein [Caldibacillus debilis]|uniref:hypothetical protein n=1 Tax=Caldibacillus debilis TaxID=301148 RepID=UPI0012B5983B|nr:hypothetical protein [Caldibacillus debilis]
MPPLSRSGPAGSQRMSNDGHFSSCDGRFFMDDGYFFFDNGQIFFRDERRGRNDGSIVDNDEPSDAVSDDFFMKWNDPTQMLGDPPGKPNPMWNVLLKYLTSGTFY